LLFLSDKIAKRGPLTGPFLWRRILFGKTSYLQVYLQACQFRKKDLPFGKKTGPLDLTNG